jgi:hypothetical protein
MTGVPPARLIESQRSVRELSRRRFLNAREQTPPGDRLTELRRTLDQSVLRPSPPRSASCARERAAVGPRGGRSVWRCLRLTLARSLLDPSPVSERHRVRAELSERARAEDPRGAFLDPELVGNRLVRLTDAETFEDLALALRQLPLRQRTSSPPLPKMRRSPTPARDLQLRHVAAPIGVSTGLRYSSMIGPYTMRSQMVSHGSDT